MRHVADCLDPAGRPRASSNALHARDVHRAVAALTPREKPPPERVSFGPEPPSGTSDSICCRGDDEDRFQGWPANRAPTTHVLASNRPAPLGRSDPSVITPSFPLHAALSNRWRRLFSSQAEAAVRRRPGTTRAYPSGRQAKRPLVRPRQRDGLLRSSRSGDRSGTPADCGGTSPPVDHGGSSTLRGGGGSSRPSKWAACIETRRVGVILTDVIAPVDQASAWHDHSCSCDRLRRAGRASSKSPGWLGTPPNLSALAVASALGDGGCVIA